MNIHFVGIGGVSMSALATILYKRGNCVSGSDISKSKIIDELIETGIPVNIGHTRRNFSDCELIVYTQAVGFDNPEIVCAIEQGVAIMERADLLGLLAREYNCTVAVSGCHGKTTTTSMIAGCILKLNPTIHIGGSCKAIGGSFLAGGDGIFLTEACEYKRSFLHIFPTVAVLLNVDADHLDYYKDISDVEQAYTEFCQNVRRGGAVIVYDGDKRALNAAQSSGKRIIKIGFEKDSDYRAEDITVREDACYDFVLVKGDSRRKYSLSVAGKHNVINALAAIAVSEYVGANKEDIYDGLKAFDGAMRRWQYLGTVNGAKLIADYAHHPREIAAVLSLARDLNPKRLIAIFQPHTYTRTQKMWNDFIEVFEPSDVVVLTPIYAAREKPLPGVSSENLARQIFNKKPDTYFCPDFEALGKKINEIARPGDMILLLGAGSIIDAEKFILK